MLPSVLHVVSSTLRQPPGVLKILIPLKIDRVSGYAIPGMRLLFCRDGFTSAIFGLSIIVIDGGGSVITLPRSEFAILIRRKFARDYEDSN